MKNNDMLHKQRFNLNFAPSKAKQDLNTKKALF